MPKSQQRFAYLGKHFCMWERGGFELVFKKKSLGKLPRRLQCMSAVFVDKRPFKFVSQVSI